MIFTIFTANTPYNHLREQINTIALNLVFFVNNTYPYIKITIWHGLFINTPAFFVYNKLIPLPVYNLYPVYTINVIQQLKPIITSNIFGCFPIYLFNSYDFDNVYQHFSIYIINIYYSLLIYIILLKQ